MHVQSLTHSGCLFLCSVVLILYLMKSGQALMTATDNSRGLMYVPYLPLPAVITTVKSMAAELERKYGSSKGEK